MADENPTPEQPAKDATKPDSKPETKQPNPVNKVPFTFDKGKLINHLEDVKSHLIETFAGKKNHNPFLFIKDNITPLETQLVNGVNTEELSKSILALDKTKLIPVFDYLVKNSQAEAEQVADKKHGLNMPK